MKKTFFTLLAALIFALTANAQELDNRNWTDGSGFWHSSKNDNGNYEFFGGYGGAGLEMELENIASNKYKTITTGTEVVKEPCTVTMMKITDGYDAECTMLVARNSKNDIVTVLGEQNDWTTTDELFFDLLDGIYTDPQGKQYNFDRNSLNGERFTTEFPDGYRRNTIQLKDGKIYWIEFTDKGIDIFNTVPQEGAPDGYYEKTILYKSLTKQDKISETLTGQYPYTSMKLLLPHSLKFFSKAQLRIMRNEIYARHGYKFASADLAAYFAKTSWYSPVSDNSKVKLSALEQLNVNIIKRVEDAMNQKEIDEGEIEKGL